MEGIHPLVWWPLVLLAAACVVLLWWCPYFEAHKRRHSKAQAIGVLTFFSIVLPPLWIGAMVWAYTEDNRPDSLR